MGSKTKYASYGNIHGSLPKLFTWKHHWAYCRSLQRVINRKSPLNAPFVILNTEKEKNIHFAESLSEFASRQKEQQFHEKKSKQVTIKFFMTVLLFGLFVMFENLNPITTIA